MGRRSKQSLAQTGGGMRDTICFVCATKEETCDFVTVFTQQCVTTLLSLLGCAQKKRLPGISARMYARTSNLSARNKERSCFTISCDLLCESLGPIVFLGCFTLIGFFFFGVFVLFQCNRADHKTQQIFVSCATTKGQQSKCKKSIAGKEEVLFR